MNIRAITVLFVLLTGFTQVAAQADRPAAQQDSVRVTLADTIRADQQRPAASSSGIDSIVVISAQDSAHFSLKRKTLRLRGDAVVTYKTQKIEAEVVEMDFGTSTLNAEGAPDSTGTISGFPIFTDQGEEFAGESMIYNFQTGRGRVKFGETSVEGGFYYGSRIKRVSEKTAYIEQGCFTTCDDPHPHFYFNSPEMKVVMDDKIYLDPVIWYVEEIPVFALPIGLFFSIERGRRSGLIMPNPLITSDRGVVLQNLGYYVAVSDYFDTELAGDFTTKGGFTLYNRSRWVLRDVYNGNADITFGYSRLNVDDPYELNFGVDLVHRHQLRPNESVNANLRFTTSRLYQNTSLNPIDRIQQNARSLASYQRTFYNGMTFNANYVRDQNMINGSVTQTPAVSFGVPQFYPLRGAIGGSHWLRDLTVTYRATGRYQHSQTRSDDTSAFAVTEYSVIEHRPGLTVTPKLGYFTLQPSVSYSENWYLQQYTQSVDPTDSTVVTTRQPGFYREYTYSAGINASTFLYGMVYPRALGISAFRHTFQPVIGLQFTPDQSDPSLGFFGEYVSPVTGKTISYRRSGKAGGIASQEQQARVNMSFLNKFSIKPMSDNDSVPARPMDLLTLNVSTSYNLAADSLNLSPITFNVRTPMLDFVEFNLSGTMNTYDQVKVADDATGIQTWRTINTSMLSAGKGLGRLTNLSINLGSNFSSAGVSFAQRTIVGDSVPPDTTREDLRSRFGRRLNAREDEVDLFGDHTRGWSSVVMPWDVSLNLSYSLNQPDPDRTFQSLLLSVRGSISLTETIDVTARGSLDLLTGQLNSPIIDITKRIHCWNLSLNWVPTGVNQGFILRFSAAAPQLQGLLITKQNTPLYR